MKPLTRAMKEADPVGQHRQSSIHAQEIRFIVQISTVLPVLIFPNILLKYRKFAAQKKSFISVVSS
jgi:hypothetical protein